jgi:hypothetical protein
MFDSDKTAYDIDLNSYNNEYDIVHFNNGKIFVVPDDNYDSDEYEEFDPEQFIDYNSKELYFMYNDLKQMSYMNEFAETATFSDFCEYIIYSRHNTSDFPSWQGQFKNFACKYYNCHKISLKLFIQHYYTELLQHYSYFYHNFSFNLGYFRDWCEFCFMYSNISKLK